MAGKERKKKKNVPTNYLTKLLHWLHALYSDQDPNTIQIHFRGFVSGKNTTKIATKLEINGLFMGEGLL